MIISVSINGVLRDVLSKFSEVYTKYEGKSPTSTVDSLDLLSFVDFKTHDELLQFLYEEAPMEIFGQASECNPNVLNHLNSLYLDGPKNQYIRLVSDELSKGKSATLWFLAKYGVMVDEILFYKNENIIDIWKKTDIFITTEPHILENKPKGKKCILVEKKYNEGLKGDKNIKTLNEIASFKNGIV